MSGQEQEARRADRAEATIDRAEQVLTELLAVAGELEIYVDRLLVTAGSPRPPQYRKKEDPPWRSR